MCLKKQFQKLEPRLIFFIIFYDSFLIFIYLICIRLINTKTKESFKYMG